MAVIYTHLIAVLTHIVIELALNQCIQKKVTYVTVIRGTFMS